MLIFGLYRSSEHALMSWIVRLYCNCTAYLEQQNREYVRTLINKLVEETIIVQCVVQCIEYRMYNVLEALYELTS